MQIIASSGIITLPSPELNDTRNQLNSVQLERAMDGTVVTTVKRVTGEKRSFQLILTRKKSIELYRFLQLYIDEKLTILWGSETLVGYVLGDPVELDILRRAEVCTSVEEVETKLEFQTVT